MTVRHRFLLPAIILVLAFALRAYHITYHDSYTDEAILAFRAIGLIDYDASPSQTTPWQWFAEVPWWGHLSLHDHPLGFLVLQHIAMTLFGAGLFAVRLPALLAGLGSVALVYFLGERLWSRRTGLVAMSLIAVNAYSLWVSRIGIQDGVVILLILLSVWFLLKSEDDRRYLLGWGAVAGLAVTVKYTSLVIFPITLVYALVYRRHLYRERTWWWGLVLAAVMTMPSWLYNIFLYRATGHFDFQISAALGQDVPQWNFRLGRMQVGTFSDRFVNFFRALYYSNSLLFNAATLGAFVYAIWRGIHTRAKPVLFLLLSCVVMWLWFFVIGSTYRFVVMVIPFFILLIGFALASLFVGNQKVKIAAYALVGFVLIAEAAFSVNSFLATRQRGRENITYAKLSEETQNFGFNELDHYLNQLLAGRVTGLFGQPEYRFIAELQEETAERLKNEGADPWPVVIIYDGDINFIAGLWLFQRRLVYEGWPFIRSEDFNHYTGGRYDAYYREQGVKDFVYIAPATESVLKDVSLRNRQGQVIEDYLVGRGVVPEVILNRRNEPAFRIYRF